MHDASLPPGQRFSPDYYRNIRYVIDPQTGRIVEEGAAGSQPLSVARYGDLSTVGLGGAPSQASQGVQQPAAPAAAGTDQDQRGAGAEGRVSSETPATAAGDIDAIGGYSTIGTGLGMLTGLPGLGMVGSAVDTVRDKNNAEEFDPEYEGNIGKWGSAFINDLTGGLLGTTHQDRARDDYQERTGTGLNDAALDAAKNPAGGGYSGPKGVVGDRADGNKDKGAEARERARSNYRETSPGRRGARDRGGQSGERGGGRGPGGGPGGQHSGSDPGGWR